MSPLHGGGNHSFPKSTQMQRGQAVPEHPGLPTPGWSSALASHRPLQSGHLSQEETTDWSRPSRTVTGWPQDRMGVGGMTGSQKEGEGTYMVHSSHIYDLSPSSS